MKKSKVSGYGTNVQEKGGRSPFLLVVVVVEEVMGEEKGWPFVGLVCLSYSCP